MQKLKVNDEVIVIAGKDKGKKGKIKNLNFKTNRVLVEGVNMVTKSSKPSQESPNGGFVQLEKSLNVSNIQVVSPKTGKGTRIKIEETDGKKIRVAVACGSEIK